MIVDLILGVIFVIIEGIVTLFTTLIPGVPGWAEGALGDVGSALGWVYQLDTWIPVQTMFTVAGAVLAAYAASLLIGIVRWVVSYFTAGGGST